MIDYILDYMGQKDAFSYTPEEHRKLIIGIQMYLMENGIDYNESREYYKNYVLKHLSIIEAADLKKYFIMYPVISLVVQIVIEFKEDSYVPKERIDELYQCMDKLYRYGLGEKYVPSIEIKQILGIFT